MTTYDEIWTTFLNKYKVSDVDLPKTNEKIYAAIHSAILDYNNRIQVEISGDDSTEMLNTILNGNDLLLLARFLRLNFLRNQETYFTNTWQGFKGDIGLKNYGDQLRNLRNLVLDEERIIQQTIANREWDYL